MAKRRRKEPPATVDYTDAEGNVLTLRESLSSGSIRKIAKARASGAATVDDDYHRRPATGWPTRRPSAGSAGRSQTTLRG